MKILPVPPSEPAWWYAHCDKCGWYSTSSRVRTDAQVAANRHLVLCK